MRQLKELKEGPFIFFQVLQKQMDLELELYNSDATKDSKVSSGKEAVIGKVYMLSLSSQPVDHEDPANEQNKVIKLDYIYSI